MRHINTRQRQKRFSLISGGSGGGSVCLVADEEDYRLRMLLISICGCDGFAHIKSTTFDKDRILNLARRPQDRLLLLMQRIVDQLRLVLASNFKA